MAKDGNNGRTGRQGNSNNGRSHKRNEHRPPTKVSKGILKLWPPPSSKRKTSLKLEEALGNEVRERLDNWRDGGDARIHLGMLVNQSAFATSTHFTMETAGGRPSSC